ncbi:DNA-binding protein RFX5 isoform X1 [Astyanax mexicanus]|uniref:DNA-binding protein RFX5 isoform X1 n=1 Tax=Astyanax mexicanus TaxID=7994 RepID=UPI000BBDD23C|nr:DNA-binding protein RFX5 isoform X1 [Astyanax mexicanus]
MESSIEREMQAELLSVVAELECVEQSIEELLELQVYLNDKRSALEAAHQAPCSSGASSTSRTGTAEAVTTSTAKSTRPISKFTPHKVAFKRSKVSAKVEITPDPDSSACDRPRRHQQPCSTSPSVPEVTTTNSGDSNSVNTADQLHTCNWIRSHLEEHADTCLPKQDVYETYRKHCENLQQRPLSAANFGKIIRDIFPNIKARRLGGRGQSKYCYSGIRRKTVLNMPLLPNLDLKNDPSELTELVQTYKQEVTEAACELICGWAQKILKRSFDTVVEIARFLVQEHIVNPRCSQAELVTSAALAGGPSKPHKVIKKIPATPKGTGGEEDGNSQDPKKDKDGVEQVSSGKQQVSEKPAKAPESSRSGGRDLQVEALMKMKKFPQILPRGSIPDKSPLSVHSSPPAFTANDSSSVKVTLPITVTTIPPQQGAPPLPVVILPSALSLSYPDQEKSTSVTVSTSAAPTPVVQRPRATAPKRGPDPSTMITVAGPGAVPPKRKRGRPRKPRPEDMTAHPVAAAAAPSLNPNLVSRGVIQKALSSAASGQSSQVMEIVLQDQQGLMVSQEVRDSEQKGVVVKSQTGPEPDAPAVLLVQDAHQPACEPSRAMVIQRAPISQAVTQTGAIHLPPASVDEKNKEVHLTLVEAPPTSSEKSGPEKPSSTKAP